MLNSEPLKFTYFQEKKYETPSEFIFIHAFKLIIYLIRTSSKLSRAENQFFNKIDVGKLKI